MKHGETRKSLLSPSSFPPFSPFPPFFLPSLFPSLPSPSLSFLLLYPLSSLFPLPLALLSPPSTAQRQSFSYFPPESRRSTGVLPATSRPHTFEDPAGHRLSMQLPGENGGLAKQEGPKMVSFRYGLQ